MTQTNITVQIGAPPRPEVVVRRRVSIPEIDSLAHAWFEAQVDPSTSVRMLIHEEVKANGVVDRLARHGAGSDYRDDVIADLRARLATLEHSAVTLTVAAG